MRKSKERASKIVNNSHVIGLFSGLAERTICAVWNTNNVHCTNLWPCRPHARYSYFPCFGRSNGVVRGFGGRSSKPESAGASGNRHGKGRVPSEWKQGPTSWHVVQFDSWWGGRVILWNTCAAWRGFTFQWDEGAQPDQKATLLWTIHVFHPIKAVAKQLNLNK